MPTRIAAPVLLLSFCALGCAHPAFDTAVSDPHVCAPSHAFPPRADEIDAQPSARVTATFSLDDVEIARAIGTLAALERLAELKASHATDDEIDAQRRRIRDRVDLAELDIESATAELACESDRAEHIGRAVRDSDSDEVRNLTIVSVLTSAATAITAGILAAESASAKAQGTVGILGGVGGASFGVGALAVHHTTTFLHPRNVLREVWRGPARTELVPSSVWTYLMRAEFGGASNRPLRDQLVASWQRSGRLGPDATHPDPTLVALYFGDGGEYDADALDRRAAMLDEVLGAMNLMHQELRDLAAEVSR